MRNLVKLAVGASVIALATPASAATFVFNSGNYVPGTTAPEPLLAPDILEMSTASNKIFSGVTMTNQSGTVNWNDGTIFLGTSALIDNRSIWNLFGNNTMTATTGGGTFVNSGIVRKSTGVLFSDFSSVGFTNNGTIDAQTGTIRFNSGTLAFNSGSVFTGAGSVDVNSSAAFNGAFTSDNLNLNAGTMTGNAAVLNGTVDWNGGSLAGGWTVASGSELNLLTASSKVFSGTDFTNDGTVNWSDGTVFLGGGALVTNEAQWNLLGDNTMTATTGGGTFVNDGTLTKSGAGGFSDFSSVGFTNNGTIDAQTGTIRFNSGTLTFNSGSVFTGAGSVDVNSSAAFNGAFTSDNLNLNSGTMTGTAAVLNGTVDWTGGSLAGGWTVANGSELNLLSASSKIFSGTDFTNDGTVNWNDGTVFLGGNALVTNSAQWNLTGDNTMTATTGGGTFVNDGTLTKSGAGGFSDFSSVGFTNNGTIDAQTGTIRFNSGTLTFNSGSVFTGAGSVDVNSSAAFNGAFNSDNLNLNSGTMTGTAAVLNGTVDWTGGSLAGGWTVANGSELNLLSASSKIFSGTDFTNDGTVNWNDGTIFLGGGAALDNQGSFTLTGNNALTVTTGGGSLVNNGLIEKTAGGGTSSIGVAFDNNGTMNVTSGTIALPANFANDGTLAGTGSYSVSGATGLTNNGTIAPGDLGMAGTLGLTGNFVQTATGTLASQIASSAISDLFNISGSGALGGTLALSCIMTCAINSGDSFVLLNSGSSLSGVFGNVTTSGFLSGFSYDLIYDYANRQVRLSILDAGMVPPPPPPPPNGAVPEPSTWAMFILGFGMLGFALRRRNAQVVASKARLTFG